VDKHAALSAIAIAVVFTATVGCAGPVEVTRTFTPDAAAAAQSDRFEPVAIVRGSQRIAIPPTARLEHDRVALPTADPFAYELAPGDVIEQDADGRIVAVRPQGGTAALVRFVPGTASSPPGSAVVRGRLAEQAAAIPLRAGDGIEMHGTVDPDERVPGGGRVESSRATGALVSGVILLILSYPPTAYAGTQTQGADRLLEVPVVGPWLDLAKRPGCVAPPGASVSPVDPCLADNLVRAAIVTSGAVQGLGALLTLIGLPSHSSVVDGADHGVGFTLVPTLGGAAAVGTF
jgi:hypothetical protein